MNLTIKILDAGNGLRIKYVQKIEIHGTTVIGHTFLLAQLSNEEKLKLKEQATTDSVHP
jgi:hypothetical protein